MLDLARKASSLPVWESPRYYSRRQGRVAPPPTRLTVEETKDAFAAAVISLADGGYFATFGDWCVDADVNLSVEGQRRLAEAIGTEQQVWPLTGTYETFGQRTGIEAAWSEDLFCDVIEALHDQAARPRLRDWHDHDAHWSYREPARQTGQAVYRWRINTILDRSELGLRLADSGEDAGRLVRVAGDPRDELVARFDAEDSAGSPSEVGHAIALFRARGAGVPEKRSAIVALARILEQHKTTLKTDLLTGDEAALFHIANKFDLRHSRADQHTDYDEAFLEWIFWWYLATVELAERLVERQSTP